MPKTALQPRKTARQARSRALVETILVAAARVLERDSLHGFNTNRVAAIAGVSVGSLYQYFPNKTALLAALIARAQDALAEAIENSVRKNLDRNLADAVASLVEIAIQHQYGNPRLAAALDYEQQRLAADGVDLSQGARIVASIFDLLVRHRGALSASPTIGVAKDCLAIAKSLVESDMGARIPPDDLAKRTTRALLGYLR